MCCSLLYIYSLLVSGFTVNKTSAILFVVLGVVMIVALLVELMIINIYRRKLHENQKKTRQLDSVQKQLQMEFVAKFRLTICQIAIRILEISLRSHQLVLGH